MASPLCLWKAVLKSLVLFTFGPQAAAELQHGSLWRHPPLSDTRVDKMEHFLWWLSTSVSDIQLELTALRKVSTWILLDFPCELWKGINGAQVVWKLIPLDTNTPQPLSQCNHSAGSMINLLAVKHGPNRAKCPERIARHASYLVLLTLCIRFMNNSSNLTSVKLIKSWLQLFEDSQLSTYLIWSTTGVNIWETMLE